MVTGLLGVALASIRLRRSASSSSASCSRRCSGRSICAAGGQTAELSKVTRAMATQVTEYTRLSRDFRLFGVETRVMDTLRRLIQDTGHVFRRAAILDQHRARPVPVTSHSDSSSSPSPSWPVPGTRGSPSSEPSSSSCCDPSATARPSRARSRASAALRACWRTSRATSVDSRTLESAPESACPSPSRWTSIPWSTPTTG